MISEAVYISISRHSSRRTVPFCILIGKRYVFMKVKKWLLGFMTFAAMAVFCAVCAGAETYGDFEYGVLDDGTVEITDYNGSAEKVDIPAEIDGKSVTRIGDSAFKYCTSLTSVTIPDSVTSIYGNAFKGCASLASVTIPNSVTSIGDSAFQYSGLASITILNGTKSIGNDAFNSCTNLTSVEISDSVTSVGDNSFANCPLLINIEISANIKKIGEKAFGYYDIYNYEKTDRVVNDIFVIYCTDSSVAASYAEENGIQYKTPCTGLHTYSDKWTVDKEATVDNFGIKSHHCTKCGFATDIKALPKTYELIYETDSEDNLYVYGFKGNAVDVVIPPEVNGKRVTSIGFDAFGGCESLTHIEIPSSVTNIDSYAFRDCTSLTGVEISNSVTSIGEDAFYGCSSLTNITIPDSVVSIGSSAFGSCISLTDIEISQNVTDIGYLAFSDCISLTDINVKADNKNYTSVNGVLFNKDKTELICYPAQKNSKRYIIPNSVTSIERFAFHKCIYLTDVTISNGVTNIENWAFHSCKSLTSINIPDSATSIGEEAFYNCESLTSITIPNSVTQIGKNALGYYFGYYNNEARVTGFKIYCYPGTAGEKYAKDNGFTYELLDKPTLSKVTGAKLGGRAADALRINWTKNASADGYIVEMYQGNKWARVGKITNNNTTTFRKSELKAGTAYKFRVKAYKMSGKTALYGNYSATVAARTNPSVIKGAKLAGRAADALRINWSKNASADGYIVEMYQGNKWVRVAKITNGNTTTFRKAGLKASSIYKFRVRAYKMSGKTALYGNYSATVTARTNPSIVKGVKIGGKAKDALRVNWTKNASAQGYIVEMYKGGKWVRVAKITNGNTTTFRKAGLAKNTAYKFRVKAYYMSGKTALYGNYGSVSGKTAAK